MATHERIKQVFIGANPKPWLLTSSTERDAPAALALEACLFCAVFLHLGVRELAALAVQFCGTAWIGEAEEGVLFLEVVHCVVHRLRHHFRLVELAAVVRKLCNDIEELLPGLALCLEAGAFEAGALLEQPAAGARVHEVGSPDEDERCLLERCLLARCLLARLLARCLLARLLELCLLAWHVACGGGGRAEFSRDCF